MNEILLVWMLMVAPSHSDMDVEWFAVQVASTDNLDQCQEMARTYIEEHAWCEPTRIYK